MFIQQDFLKILQHNALMVYGAQRAVSQQVASLLVHHEKKKSPHDLTCFLTGEGCKLMLLKESFMGCQTGKFSGR